ncbi:NAD(P)-binding domain-containing protein [Streptomyces sp. DSM 42041]|uniref:NAD(P)-binding domain-containing protein n=1 Tax=Streptomyces hazeniae TaxID=3075538 RepID=A0ABU2NUT0_9ACTN|nr:NAD(P)-binding domain-containing protein [Streptomyces sp. DSM 42041]MDT0379757.1 NAD(P)-binding domain-containing protein [Streptomyces sp. DSM 42041]
MRIGILGTGNVARALGEGWAAAGHEVVLGSRAPAERGDAGPDVRSLAGAAAHGEVLVNATPGTESEAVLASLAGEVPAGTVLVDVGIGFTLDGALAHPGVSLGERLQAAHPALRVVKTLCTVTASVMRDPGGLSGPSTVFLSGDDAGAKAVVGGLLHDLGWPETALLDLGGIGTARGQEHFALLFLGVAGALGSHAFNVRVVPEADTATVAAARTARRSHRYAEAVAFYRDVVRLPVVHLAEDGPDGHGVAVFGLPGTPATFELLPEDRPLPGGRPHEQLVLYFPGRAARDAVVGRLADAGHEPVGQNRYWTLNDAVTFRDPDGAELVLAPWVFGAEPPPARRRRAGVVTPATGRGR